MSKPSFRIDDLGGIVLVHGFDDIHNHYEGWERELPALKSAIRESGRAGREGVHFRRSIGVGGCDLPRREVGGHVRGGAIAEEIACDGR